MLSANSMGVPVPEDGYRTFEAFLGVARAKFLALPVALIAVGAAASAVDGAFDPVHTGVALLGLVAAHVAVNVFNEYSDYRTGIDEQTEKTPFSGGSGTLPREELAPQPALWFAIGALGVAGLVFLYFLFVIGPVIVPLVLVGLVTIVGYTDFLARIGLGEIAAGFGLGTLPIIGAALVQDGTVGPTTVAASIPAFFLTFNLLLLNEFPDQDPDRQGGRNNLIHIFGRRTGAWLYLLAGVAVPIVVIGAVLVGTFPPLAAVAVIPSIFLARQAHWTIQEPETAVSVEALRDNVIWVLFTNFFLAAGLAFPAGAFFAATSTSVNEGVFLVGRMLFGIVLGFMAFNNLADLGNIAEQIGEVGMPYPKVATVVTSVPLLLAALSIALGVYPTLGAAYVVVFLTGTTVIVHNFLGMDDPDEQENEIFHFLKNLLILAGTLVLLSMAIEGSAWSYGIGPTLF